MMIDTHCHLLDNDYDNLEKVIANMKDNIIVASGADSVYNKEVVKLINKYEQIYGTIGLHPDEAKKYNDTDVEFLKQNIFNNKIVGIGEIGLDYYYENDEHTKEKQKELFLLQLDLARKYNKPVVIHSRDAIEDTYNILKKYKDLKMIIHCFSGSLEMAKLYTLLGAKLGIGGVLTFKNSKRLQEVVEKIDLKYLVLETDSPYLAPEPFRGKTNEPANISLVARKIAEIKQIDVSEVYEITTKNALEVYNIKA